MGFPDLVQRGLHQNFMTKLLFHAMSEHHILPDHSLRACFIQTPDHGSCRRRDTSSTELARAGHGVPGTLHCSSTFEGSAFGAHVAMVGIPEATAGNAENNALGNDGGVAGAVEGAVVGVVAGAVAAVGAGAGAGAGAAGGEMVSSAFPSLCHRSLQSNGAFAVCRARRRGQGATLRGPSIVVAIVPPLTRPATSQGPQVKCMVSDLSRRWCTSSAAPRDGTANALGAALTLRLRRRADVSRGHH